MLYRLGYSCFQTGRENDKKRLSGVKVKDKAADWKKQSNKIDRPQTSAHISHVHTHTHTLVGRQAQSATFMKSFVDDVIFLILIFNERNIITCLLLSIIW